MTETEDIIKLHAITVDTISDVNSTSDDEEQACPPITGKLLCHWRPLASTQREDGVVSNTLQINSGPAGGRRICKKSKVERNGKERLYLFSFNYFYVQ